MDAVKRESVPPVDWRAIDAKVMAAAESTAADIRSGALRPARRALTTVYAGAALAAAAAALFAWRMNAQHTSSRSLAHVPVAVHSHATSSETPHETQVAARPAEPVDGTVLMVVAPVGYTAPGASEVPLAATTPVRQGSRIAVDDHGGRAVLALHSGYRLDARSGATVAVARLDTRETLLALSKGEARVEGPRLDDERVALEAGGWTLHAKGGAFVAKIESDVVRLRVLSGKVAVSRGGGDEQEIVAGEEIELAKESTGMRVVSHDARDPNELDVAFLADDGHVFDVPEVPGATSGEHASVAVAGFGTLPAGVSSLRARGALTLRAQVGGESLSMVLEPSGQGGAAWRRLPRVVASRSSASAASSAAVAVVARGPAVAASATPAPTEQNAQRSAPQTHADVQAELERRTAHCFASCLALNNCALAGSDRGQIHIDTNSRGGIDQVRPSGLASTELTACITHEAQSLTFPRSMWSTTVYLYVVAPRR